MLVLKGILPVSYMSISSLIQEMNDTSKNSLFMQNITIV